MLFNSYVFLFAFFPTVLAVYFLIGSTHRSAALFWLAAASIFFYGWWDLTALPILLASIAFNFAISRWLIRHRSVIILWLGICANIGLLVYYKYLPESISLPIGISFFTFTQLAYLVDCYRDRGTGRGLLDYVLFVTYFPHLIAGPILHHAQMMPQFARRGVHKLNLENLSMGLTLLSLGLIKKVLIADPMQPAVASVFDGTGEVGLITAWLATLAYTMQIYFDFSGYTDMALGISKCFNIDLPINFVSPYQATSIIDFWRRWHISLSNFLRDYIYIPLGGNREGDLRRYTNILMTMLIGGLWHGGQWTFILWGAVHGMLILLNHIWRDHFALKRWRGSWPMTFILVAVAWILFRAPTLPRALEIFAGLINIDHLGTNPLSRISSVVLSVACGLAWFAPNGYKEISRAQFGGRRANHWLAYAAGIGLSLSVLSLNKLSPFLYFRF